MPAAALVSPIIVPSIAPPLISTVVTLPKSAHVLPAAVQLLPKEKELPSSAEIVSKAIFPTLVILPSETLKLVNVPAAALVPPIIVPSIAPPFIATEPLTVKVPSIVISISSFKAYTISVAKEFVSNIVSSLEPSESDITKSLSFIFNKILSPVTLSFNVKPSS